AIMDDAIARDPVGRVAAMKKEIEWANRYRDEACLLTDLLAKGELPLRVTHNDTKINNVLFDSVTGEPLTIIDLDTVMPGVIGNDFGDAIRFAGNYVAEDCPDTEHAGLNLDVFKAFAEGYLTNMTEGMTEKEIETLPMSCFCLTAELAVRWITDYILGDPYFKINYPEHNLVRTRCQIALADDLMRRMNDMQEIIARCVGK
ncbi:MAG: aminoglycoside phosphotransferase family protein, partial [Clostridia bacterium]|nr:aminoglycoside phosphotransferase family protein [Clostridia bacterium]